MFGQRTTGIEEQVTRSAASLLYGHAMAWDVPGRRGLPQRAPGRRAVAARRFRAIVAGRRLARRQPVVVVDAGPCS